MPAPGQFVLVYGDFFQGALDGPKMAVFQWWHEEWWDANMDYEQHDGAMPSHWMPLPEAP